MSPSRFKLHELPHHIAMWWLVSWTTYGSWLPGDPRGFCTWREREYVPPPQRYAKPGESTYSRGDYRPLHAQAQARTEDAVRFTPRQMRLALTAMIIEITDIPIRPAILALGSWHVHWLCQFGIHRIRSTIGRVKAAATRELNAQGFASKRPLTKGCNMKSKSDRRAYDNAYAYIQRHIEQACLIHEWEVNDIYLPSR